MTRGERAGSGAGRRGPALRRNSGRPERQSKAASDRARRRAGVPAVYLDGHATTPLDPRVLEVMLPFLARPGNASSVDHAFGRAAREAVESARAQVAALIGASSKEIVFTSGATEANNLALKGVAGRAAETGRHIVTVVTEHPSVLEVCAHLEADGVDVTYLPVDAGGRVDPEQVRAAIRPATIVVSVMAANNEIGTVQPIDLIGRITRERGVLLHTDAAQAGGKIPLDVAAGAIDLMSLSAHKMHGPQGVGALYVCSRRPTVRLEPQQRGGAQERGLRAGTLNTAGIVGLGAAADLAAREMADEALRLAALRDDLLARLREAVPGLVVNGSLVHRLPNNLSVRIAGADETLASRIEGVAVSAGSACATGSIRPSHVLRAIGVDAGAAHGTLRFGLTRFTTADEIPIVVERVAAAVRALRASRCP